MNQQTKKIKWLYYDMPMEAIILYTSKDYKFSLFSPFHQTFEGMHMMYLAPISYGCLDGEEPNIMQDGMTIKNLRPIVIERCNRWINETMQFIVLKD
jgi:hypothetical protein